MRPYRRNPRKKNVLIEMEGEDANMFIPLNEIIDYLNDAERHAEANYRDIGIYEDEKLSLDVLYATREARDAIAELYERWEAYLNHIQGEASAEFQRYGDQS